MAIRGLSVLALVPARGGSKSISKKNLCLVGGLSLVARVAAVVSSIDWIDFALLSTDDKDIAAEGMQHGLSVPFLRPDKLARDDTTALATWQHDWLAVERHCQQQFDIAIWLQPTSPTRIVADVEMTVNALLTNNCFAAATVSRLPGHYHPEKILQIDANNYLEYYVGGQQGKSLRQQLTPYYYRNGLCYAAKRQCILELNSIIEYQCYPVVIDRPVVNIDEPYELALANWMTEEDDKIKAAT